MSKEIQLESSPTEKDVAVHVLPCHIAYDGISKVSEFFKTRPDPVDPTVSVSFFRGRKLCGRTVPLPKHYTGHVFRPINPVAQFDRTKYGEEDQDEDEEEIEKVHWNTTEKCESITVWEHHALPDEKQDHWIRGIEEWTRMADITSTAGYDTDLEVKGNDRSVQAS